MISLTELFDKGAYKWKRTKALNGYYRYEFDGDGIPYVVAMNDSGVFSDDVGLTDTDPSGGRYIEDVYTVEFYYKDPNLSGLDAIRQDVTGSGNEFRVFATVVDIMKDFIKSAKPRAFTFSAKEKNRRKLYDALVKKLGKGYNVSKGKASGEQHYLLYKGKI